jgi:hypothetical protein
MNSYRYTLEKYKTKATQHTCPRCNHKKEFIRYIDNETGLYLADDVGRCNREDNCGYHCPPKQFFEEHPERKPEAPYVPVKLPEVPPVYVPLSEVALSRNDWEHNSFYLFLRDTFGDEPTTEAIEKYPIGTMQHTRWKEQTIFWFVDRRGNIRAGQVKAFDEKGHTKTYEVDSKKHPHTNWYHRILEKHTEQTNEVIPEWVKPYSAYVELEGAIKCMFGEHLLTLRPNDPVAVVEAPKTAIIASMFYPQYVWVAVGAKSYLNTTRCAALKNRDVTLFPDLGAYKDWEHRSNTFQGFAKSVCMDTTLENIATSEMRENKADLADWLVMVQQDLWQAS